MEKGEPDPNITEQDAWEFKLALLEREGRLVENVLNEENEGFEAINARTIGGFTLEHIDSVQEAKQLKIDGTQYIGNQLQVISSIYLMVGRCL